MANNEEEISIKEIIVSIRQGIKFLFSRWLFILIAGIIGGAFGLWYAFNAKPEYTASLSFILSNNSQSGNGILGLASQFGIDVTSGSNDVFLGDNIISLMTSRR